MKQTAVEWLKKQLEDYGSPSQLSLYWSTFDILCEQAKEMEKQQIIDATIYGDRFEGCYGLDSEQYYKETYKQD